MRIECALKNLRCAADRDGNAEVPKAMEVNGWGIEPRLDNELSDSEGGSD